MQKEKWSKAVSKGNFYLYVCDDAEAVKLTIFEKNYLKRSTKFSEKFTSYFLQHQLFIAS